jgi:hypothetical protein
MTLLMRMKIIRTPNNGFDRTLNFEDQAINAENPCLRECSRACGNDTTTKLSEGHHVSFVEHHEIQWKLRRACIDDMGRPDAHGHELRVTRDDCSREASSC